MSFAAVPEAVLGCCNRTYFQRVLRDRIMRVWAPRFDNETFEDAFQAVDWNYSEWPHIYDNENNRQSFVRVRHSRHQRIILDLPCGIVLLLSRNLLHLWLQRKESCTDSNTNKAISDTPYRHKDGLPNECILYII